MKTHTHTPGPWSVSNGLPTVWAKDGERQIADCDKGPIRSTGEDLANAQLIAAAPDLLAALVDMVEQFGHYCEHTEDEKEIQTLIMARAAISKAEGRE